MLPDKALALGCIPNKHFKKLIAGESVTLKNGTLITSEMVTEDRGPVPAFLLIFLNSES
jgi:hypothetical protein